MKKLLPMLLFFLVPAVSFGQGSAVNDIAFKNLITGIAPAAGATVTVCTSAGTGIPCTPLATVYSDIALTKPITPPILADSNGYYSFFAPSGTYIVTVTGAGTSGRSVTYTLPFTLSGNNTYTGNNTFTGTMTFTNHNAMFWAGPGATPTIDQAITSCGVNTCIVEISPLYTGPESTNLVTTSMGYQVSGVANNVVIHDMRGNQGTVGNPVATPLYHIIYGGRQAGQLTKTGCNQYAAGVLADSTVCSTNFTWVNNATMPTNNGSMFGTVDAVFATGSLTIGSATNITFAGEDAEAYNNATSQDKDMPYITGGIAQSGISRTNATSNITTSSAHAANQCANASTSGAKIENCYGYDSFFGTSGGLGVARNYGFHNKGNWLTESNTSFDFVDAGFNITALSEAAFIATVTTSGVCTFPTGASVYISGTGTNSFGYNGTWTVLAPGCNGTNTFTYTNTVSGLGALGAVGIVAGVHKGLFFDVANTAVTMNPYLDTVGWKFVSNAGTTLCQIKTVTSTCNTAFTATGTIGATSSGGAYLGGAGSELAGLYLRETTAPTGAANDTVCGGESVSHTLQCSYNNGTVGTVPLINRAQTWSAAQSFGAGQVLPTSAGLAVIGTTALPVGTVQIGTAATNNFALTPAVTAAARTINIPDPGAASTLALDASSTYVPATNVFTGAWICTNVTPVTANANVATDQNLMACTIPAGVLNRVGRTLRVWLAGVYTTPAASVSQMTVKVKLCTVSGCGSGTVITPVSIQSTALASVQVTNDNWSMEERSTTQTAGASSAYEAHGDFLIDLTNLTTGADSTFGDTNTATVGTIDSTAQLFLQCTFAFSTASASNSVTQRQLIAETIN